MELSQEQEYALSHIQDDVGRGKRLITLGGLAGTGKTTVLSELAQCLPHYAVCAYTGKAANVLRSVGIDYAATIHSTIYIPPKRGSKLFHLKKEVDYYGFIIDEASMIKRELHRDIKSFGLPIIYCGDHGQLEPVKNSEDDPTPFNLMHDPTYKLETVHRNCGDIARFALWLREGKLPKDFVMEDGTVELIESKQQKRLVLSTDQTICAYNLSKDRINLAARKELGYKESVVQKGERVMCLRNNKRSGLFNGQQGEVYCTGDITIDFSSNGLYYSDVHYDPITFGNSEAKPEFKPKDPCNYFDYAYCITAHKAQGDQWGSVVVIEQRCKEGDHKRWSYTCASRAKDKLYWRCL